jgi:Type ISP C-terminal specificity domain
LTLQTTKILPRYRYRYRYRYTKSGERVDSITDWAVAQFVDHYNPPRNGEGDRPLAVEGAQVADTPVLADRGDPSVSPRGLPPPRSGEDFRGALARSGEDFTITKDAIFAYCYAVLRDPAYREKYALKLTRVDTPLNPDGAAQLRLSYTPIF